MYSASVRTWLHREPEARAPKRYPSTQPVCKPVALANWLTQLSLRSGPVHSCASYPAVCVTVAYCGLMNSSHTLARSLDSPVIPRSGDRVRTQFAPQIPALPLRRTRHPCQHQDEKPHVRDSFHDHPPGFPICLLQMAPIIHPKAAQRTKFLFVTASSRFRGRHLSPW